MPNVPDPGNSLARLIVLTLALDSPPAVECLLGVTAASSLTDMGPSCWTQRKPPEVSRDGLVASYGTHLFVHADYLCHSLADPLRHRFTVLDAEAMGDLILINVHSGFPVLSKMHNRALM